MKKLLLVAAVGGVAAYLGWRVVRSADLLDALGFTDPYGYNRPGHAVLRLMG